VRKDNAVLSSIVQDDASLYHVIPHVTTRNGLQVSA
jgi:hypothetical protein